MAKVSRCIFINASVEKVFECHTDPNNNTQYWPSMVEVKDIEDHPTGGKKFNWVYKMAGLHFEGITTPVEWVLNRRLVIETKGGIESTFVYDYELEGEGIRLSMEVDYKVAVPVLGKPAESFRYKDAQSKKDPIHTFSAHHYPHFK